jgi:DNA-binding MarR family transcriptional regulator
MTSTVLSSHAASVMAALTRTRWLSTHLSRLLHDQLGCTRQQADTLAAIRDGAVRLNEVAQATGQHVSGTSRLIDTMVGDELVDRRLDPDDRRAVVLELTPHGAQLLDQVHALIGQIVDDALARLPERARAQLPRLLDEFLAAVDLTLHEPDPV